MRTIEESSRISRIAVSVVAAIVVAIAASGCGVGGPTLGARRAGPVSDAVVASIALSDYATDIAVRADGARAFVPLRTNKVLAVDLAGRRVADTIRTDGQPYAIALTSDGARAYVADMTAQYVFVLDTAANQLVKQIPIGIIARPVMPPAVAVSHDGAHAYVTEATATDDHLLVVDTATNEIVGDHFLGIHPAGVAVSPDNRLVYVVGCKLSCIDGTLLVLDAATADVVSQVALASAPGGLALAADGARAYVPNERDATVAVVDLATRAVTTIPVDPQPAGIAVDPRGARVYVTSYAAATVSAIDTATMTVAAKVRVPSSPRAIAVSPDGRSAYVLHTAPTCSVLDLRRLTTP